MIHPIGRDHLLSGIHEVHPTAAVFTVTPGYYSALNSVPDSEPNLPPLLSALYDPSLLGKSEEELLRVADTTFEEMSVDKEEAIYLEQSTRNQSASCLWFDHRLGRLTASTFGSVMKYTERKYPASIVKSVMQYTSPSSHIPAINWGRVHESNAQMEYTNHMKSRHRNFSISPAGLFLNAKYPYLGASPDGVVLCDCCGLGLLEIKCPFKYRDTALNDISDPHFCLQPDVNNKLCLIKTHDYYYQVQGQLGVCDSTYKYCDFVCWTLKGISTERIEFDSVTFDHMVETFQPFYVKYIIHELLTRKLKSQMEENAKAEELFCYCRRSEFGEMIACDNPACKIEWFHFGCVGLTTAPNNDWYCDDCIGNVI